MPLVALLDTNVWVSAFLKPSGPPGQVVSSWSRDKFSAVTSLSQLTELAQVLNRPRLLRRFKYSHWEAARLVRLIAARATLVEISGELKACRDPDDDKILDCALSAGAKYIVSGDKDLLSLDRFQSIEIVTPAAFLKILRHK